MSMPRPPSPDGNPSLDPSAQRAYAAISAVPDLAGLDQADVSALARVAHRQAFAAGDVVFREGEPCAGAHIVEAGWLKAVKFSEQGREQVVRVVGPGDLFNEIGVLASRTNIVTVVALESCVLWLIACEDVYRLLAERPALSQAVIRSLAKRILHLMDLVEDLSLRTIESRLARLLLADAQAGVDVVHRQRWTTQAEMAARLGTVPDVLQRALRQLSAQGIIEVERHQIRILDRKKLEEMSR